MGWIIVLSILDAITPWVQIWDKVIRRMVNVLCSLGHEEVSEAQAQFDLLWISRSPGPFDHLRRISRSLLTIPKLLEAHTNVDRIHARLGTGHPIGSLMVRLPWLRNNNLSFNNHPNFDF